MFLGSLRLVFPVVLHVEVDKQHENNDDDGQEQVDDEVRVVAVETQRVGVVHELSHELSLDNKVRCFQNHHHCKDLVL